MAVEWMRCALLFGLVILSSVVATRGIVLGEEEDKLLHKLLDEFYNDPMHWRYDCVFQPCLPDAKLLPKVFIWCPMQHYGTKVYCPNHKCLMRFSGWTSDLKAQSFRGPRLIYDLHGDIILVQSIYRCSHNLPASRMSHGHEYTSASPEILKSLPKDLEMKFPLKLYYRSGCSQDLLDYLIVHIGRGQNFLELSEDIASMNFRKFLQLHKDSTEEAFYESLVYSCPSNDQLMHMFLAYFNSVEALFQNEMGKTPCSILTCDHTYKVGKHIGIMRNSDHTFVNQFNNIFIGVNEYGQVVTWRLTKSTAFDQIQDLLVDLKSQLDASDQSLTMIIVDDCCSVRPSYNRVFPGVRVLQDVYHICQRFTKTLPKICAMSRQLFKEFGLIFRADGDTGEDRKMPTPSIEIIDANLQMFLNKWESELSNSTMDSVRNIRKHILKGCCSGIPPGAGTNRNERLHKHLKRSLLGGASTISPELALAVFSIVLYSWSCKRDPNARRHTSNSRIIPVAPVEMKRNHLATTHASSSLKCNMKFKSGDVPTEVPATMSHGKCNSATVIDTEDSNFTNINTYTVDVADLKNGEILKYVLDRALHLNEVLSSVERQCITRDFNIFHFPFSDVKRMVSVIHSSFVSAENSHLEMEMNRECLQRHLSSFGLQLDSVPGDGNCCFKSIIKEVHKVIANGCNNNSQYIQYLKSIGLGNTVDIDTDHLRHLFCEEIERNSERYRMWVDFDVKSELEKFSKSGWFNSSLGDLCVIGCSNVLKIPIMVITALPRSPFIPFVPSAIQNTKSLYIAFNHSFPGHYDATKVVNEDNGMSGNAKKGCNCGLMAKQHHQESIASCDSSSRCSCVKRGEKCSRECRCVNCENSSKEEMRPSIGMNKGCTCGITKKGDPTYVSCKNSTTRKSKCPCLRKTTYCSSSCKCCNCGNQKDDCNSTCTATPTGKSRRRCNPEPYQRTRGTEFLAERGFEITSGPWTELESTVLYVVIEVISSTGIPFTSKNISVLYNFVASSKLVSEMALPVDYKSFSKIVGKLSYVNSKHSVFESLMDSILNCSGH